MKRVITYGTFDLLHYGHIELLRRAKELAEGGPLFVGVSSDAFNAKKGKESHLSFKKRCELVQTIRYVDEVISEDSWEQKLHDIKKNRIDLFVMGSDWQGKFDDLKNSCEVIYLDRTEVISSTLLRDIITNQNQTRTQNVSK